MPYSTQSCQFRIFRYFLFPYSCAYITLVYAKIQFIVSTYTKKLTVIVSHMISWPTVAHTSSNLISRFFPNIIIQVSCKTLFCYNFMHQNQKKSPSSGLYRSTLWRSAFERHLQLSVKRGATGLPLWDIGRMPLKNLVIWPFTRVEITDSRSNPSLWFVHSLLIIC